MDTIQQANAEQIALWNGGAGRGWVEAQESLDRLFGPFEDLLVEAVATSKAKRVLDVGCGTGSTTLAIARRVGSKGTAVGLDISEPMIALAKQRAEIESAGPRFLCADAQTYGFDNQSFDLIVSRFGVMFFDASVRAFANLKRTTTKGGELKAIVWRNPAHNPFMIAAERAAAPFLPQIPARTLPLHELDDYITRLGPLGRVLPQLDEQKRARIVETVRTAFDPYVHGTEVRFTAACWIVGARA